MNRRLIAVVLLVVAPVLVSCKKKPRPVPLPAKIPVHAALKPAPGPLAEAPPEIAVNEPDLSGLLPSQAPLPPPPPPAKRRPSPAGPRVAAPIEPAAPPISPAPQLRPMLTPAQRQELDRAVSERLRRAQAVLTLVRGRNLSGEQLDLANQIRTFVKLAEEARATDLLRANNLAERAEVLAQDLAQRVR